jgi:putrescine---pyruvate transaminase
MTQFTVEQLIELDKKHFLHPTSSIAQQQANGPAVIFKEGKGIYLTDVNGKQYIDGMSSLWNVNIGHGREEIAETAKEQIETLAFTSSFSTFSNTPAIELAAKIASIAPGDLNTVFFTSGGSESNDTAIKLARHYWLLKGQLNRQTIISRQFSYHGVAMGATNATGLKAFRDFTNSPSPNFAYTSQHDAQSLRQLIEELGAESVAAFISEPVQGAGGVHMPSPNYFKEVRTICDEYGILFIADEVITGYGRTGKMFAMEHFDVVPDMLCFAKGITSGYVQLGGVLISEKIHADLCALSTGNLLHGYTYSGHALACKVGLKNLEIIEREQLVTNAKVVGETLLAGFEQLLQKYSFIDHVRALGLVGGISFSKNRATSERFEQPLSPIVVEEALKRGLIIRAVTFDQDSLVFAPPLISTHEQIADLLAILDETLGHVEATVVQKA